MPFRTARTTVGAVAFLLAVAGGLGATLWYSHAHSTSSSAAAGSTGVDFSNDPDANGAASDLAQKLLTDVQPLAGYAGLQIVRYGIEVDVVGAPSEAIQATVARDDT